MKAGELEVAGSVAACGARPLPMARCITVHARGNGRHHLGGLAHCGRFQVCPSCTPYLAHRRMEALQPLAARLAADEGLRHFMVVLSVRHHRGARFRVLVDALRKMAAALRQGHPWRNVVAGYLRLAETTWGPNGHHPHFHLLLSLRAGEAWEPEGFFVWIRYHCEAMAREAGRSCDFAPGWWSEIPRERLVAAAKYGFASDKLGTSSLLAEVHASSTKHTPIWCIPAKAYAEVYRESKGMRWYAVGGCWKTPTTAASDEELAQARQDTGTIFAHIPRQVWTTWTPRERRDHHAILYDPSLADPQAVACLIAWGGVEGPPPEPDWGEPLREALDPSSSGGFLRPGTLAHG